MRAVSTTRPVRLVPEGQDGLAEEKRVAYLLKVPGVYDRAAYRRQVKSRGVRLHLPADLRAAMRADIAAAREAGAFGEDEARAAAETVDAFEAAVDGDEEAVPEDLRLAFDDFEAALRRLGGAYARRLAESEHFFEISMIEGVRQFVVGWENVAAPFERREPDGLTEAALGAIPDEHMRAIDARLTDLMGLGGDGEKNSGSPSPGSSAPTDSPTASSSPRKPRRKTTRTSGRSRKSASTS